MTNLVSYSARSYTPLNTLLTLQQKKNTKVKPIIPNSRHINSTQKLSNDFKTITVIMAEQQG